MKKFFSSWMLAVLLALTALSLSACADKKPEAVVEQFYQAVFDDKTDEAMSYFSLADVEENDMTAVKGKLQMVIGGMSSGAKKAGGLQSMKTTVLKQEEAYAEVETEFTFKNNDVEKKITKLVKEDGKWKIALK